MRTAKPRDLKPLLQARDRLLSQAEALKFKIEGFDMALAMLANGHDAEPSKSEPDKPASSVKVLLLDLAQEAGASGINARIAVEMATHRGGTLLRGTAASNLSRLKADKALVHKKDRYFLPEFAPA